MLHRPSSLAALRSSSIRRLPLRSLTATAVRYNSIVINPETTTPEPHESLESVGIIGGGISGLATAWYFSKFAPDVPVTLFERSPRLGGWVHSKRVKHDAGEVLFETGPRTLRPWSITGMATLDMIRQLELEDQLYVIKKDAVAAQNKYIYYPDQLNKLPADVGSFFGALRLPVMKGVFGGLFPEIFKKPRTPDVTDESVGNFITRRLGRPLAENIISAALHGIYAGDMDQLSMKSLFPKEWRDERVHGSLARGVFTTKKAERIDDIVFRAQLQEANRPLLRKLKGAVMYCFKYGMETLTDAIVKDLRHSNVKIITEAAVDQIKWNDEYFQVTPSGSTTPHKFSHLISTLYAPRTNDILPADSKIPELSEIPASTVLVVNLYYPSPTVLPVTGFGYLIPKSVSPTHNPHNALGVIFDSDTYRRFTEPGTKLTVMMGGHYWAGRDPLSFTDEEAVDMATETLKIQLGGEFHTQKPLAWNVALQRDCIPQYTVGHEERCLKAREELYDKYLGRLSVVGSSYKGVGLSDCIRHAREVAVRLVGSGKGSGLEDVEKRWAVREKRQPGMQRK